MEILAVGNIVSFFYPAANYLGARADVERRRLRIASVRDLRDRPLEPATLEAFPGLRRGTVLVTGIDLDKGAERSFYVESMSRLRLARERFKLRKLKILITEEPSGKIIRVESLIDPREYYTKHFNKLPHSFRAWPITV